MANPIDSFIPKAAQPHAHSALIVVDVQNGFCPGGHLAVTDGDAIVPLINRLMSAFGTIVLTQDWHPADHVSFAANHQDKHPFDTIELDYGTQVLWSVHCVQGSHDAAFHQDLNVNAAQVIIRKGFRKAIDSYSAFVEADRRTMTGLSGYLRERGIDTVYVVGLATDFCVAWTALDARRLGFACYVIEDACRGIDLNGSMQQAWADMEAAGVVRVQSFDIVK